MDTIDKRELIDLITENCRLEDFTFTSEGLSRSINIKLFCLHKPGVVEVIKKLYEQLPKHGMK